MALAEQGPCFAPRKLSPVAALDFPGEPFAGFGRPAHAARAMPAVLDAEVGNVARDVQDHAKDAPPDQRGDALEVFGAWLEEDMKMGLDRPARSGRGEEQESHGDESSDGQGSSRSGSLE